MNHTSLKQIVLFGLSFFLAHPSYAGKDSHGGVGVIQGNQTYLLDLVEVNIEQQLLNRELTGLVKPQDNPENAQEIFLVTSTGKERRWIKSPQSLKTLDMFVAKSSFRNGYLFGQRHKDRFCTNCFTQSAELSVFLTNVLDAEGIPAPSEPITFSRYLLLANAFNSLNWIVVNSPLELTGDENSSVSTHVKFQLATRTTNTIRISEQGWSRDFIVSGIKVQPLDLFNRAALILHEMYYFVTAQQGDTTSDRARKLNACRLRVVPMQQYLEEYYQRSLDECSHVDLFKIPGTPSSRPHFVSQIAPGSKLEVLRDISLSTSSEAFIFLLGSLISHDTWWSNYYPFRDGTVALYKRRSPYTEWGRIDWSKGETIQRGTRFTVTSTYVKAANTDMVTHVSFSPANQGSVMYLEVKTPNPGIPATISQMESMMDNYLRWDFTGVR